jgi:type IV pilus assembly protein PilM
MSIRTGIDLGTTSVKLVRGEGRVRLERITHLDGENWDPGEPGGNGNHAVERAAGALGRILGRLGGTRHRLGRIAVGVGGEEAGLREVLLPRLGEEEIRRALPFEARKHLTLEQMTAPTIAFQVLGSAPPGEGLGAPQDRVLLAAVSSPQRDFALRVLQTHGLEPEVIDLEPLANLNALLAALPVAELGDGAVVGLLDIGGRETGLHLTQADGGLLTRTVGPGSPGPQGSAQNAGFVEDLARRVQETLTFYRGRYRRDVASLYLGGGGAMLEGLRPALQAALDLPVRVLNPLEGVALPATAGDDVAAWATRYVTACGLCRWWDGAHV